MRGTPFRNTPERLSVIRLFAILLILAAPHTSANAADSDTLRSAGQTREVVERDIPEGDFFEDDILILQAQLGKYLLSDGILGFLHRGGVMLPLGEMCRIVDFPIEVEPDEGLANGWFLSESRLFSLNHSRSEVVVEGQIQTYDASLVRVDVDDIYVDAALLSRWLPLDFTLDLPRLIVKLSSREPLPFEQKLKREELWQSSRRGRASGPKYPRQSGRYNLLDWPVVDATTSLGFGRGSGPGQNTRYSGLVSGDFLLMTSSLFLTGSDETTVEELRLSLSRTDPDNKLLGPLGASKISFGDIFSPQQALTASSRAGRGIEITNFPVTRPSEFDRTTMQGELLPDWEVELYRNEVLLDFQLSRGDGRYEFVDVPLLFGMNILRLAFYGPQGQKYEHVERILIGPGLLRPGEKLYRVAFNQQDVDVFLVGVDTTVTSQQGEDRLLAEYEQGISRRISLSLAGASIPLRSGRRKYGSVGIRAALFGAFTRIDASRDNYGGMAFKLTTQGNPLGLDLLLEHGQFFDFLTESISESTDPITSQTQVRLDGVIPRWILPRISLGGTGRLELRESGSYRLNGSNRISFFFAGISVSNSTNGSLSGGGGSLTTTQVNSSFLMNLRRGKMSLRGQLNYLPPPGPELTDIALTGDYRLAEELTLRAGVSRQLINNRLTRYTASVNHSNNVISLGLAGSYLSEDDFSVRLNMSFSFGVKPRSKSPILRSARLGSSGIVSARVFLDQNQNGRFDEGDEALEGVRFLRDGRRTEVRSGADGVGFMTGLASYKPVSISVDASSLEDPYWVSRVPGIEVVPRPGKAATIDFPIGMTGEVDGIVYLQGDQDARAVSNAEIQLVDTLGTIIQTTKTAFDGFYLFTLVPTGSYTVRIAPEQVARLNLEQPEEWGLIIDASGTIASNIDFILIRKVKEL